MGIGSGGGGGFGSGSGGSGRTLPLLRDLSLALDPSPSRRSLGSVPPADADVGVGGSGCVGGGDSGGPRGVTRCCTAECGRVRRGASMSSELKSTGSCDCACAWGSTGSARLRELLRVLPPLRRAEIAGKLLWRRSRRDGRGEGGSRSGRGLLEGGGGGGEDKDGELGCGAVVLSAGVDRVGASMEMGCCAFALSDWGARRLCARLRHITVNTTDREMTRMMGRIIAAARRPPDGLFGRRWSIRERADSIDGDTHEEEDFGDDVVSASLISVYLRIIRRGDMPAKKWMRN